MELLRVSSTFYFDQNADVLYEHCYFTATDPILDVSVFSAQSVTVGRERRDGRRALLRTEETHEETTVVPQQEEADDRVRLRAHHQSSVVRL